MTPRRRTRVTFIRALLPAAAAAASRRSRPLPYCRGSDKRAAALILVLWAVAILALLAGGLTFAVRQDLMMSNLQRDRLAAHVLARAGIEQATAIIMDESPIVDALDDDWCDDPLDLQDMSLSGGTFTVAHGSHDPLPEEWYGVEDESGKLNLNVATQEQMLKLEDMTEPIAAAIIDWRDRDDDPQPQGIEGSHYSALAHPYVIRNGSLRSTRELMLVRGVSPELFWGEDLNGNGLLDANEDDGDASPPRDNSDGRLDRGWFAYVTVFSYAKNVNALGQKRLNINSAEAGQLTSQLSLEDWAAQSIVKARQDRKFEHLVDLLDVNRDTDGGSEVDHDKDINARGRDEQDKPVTQGIFQRIVDDITLKDEEVLAGLINVNTAPREVLVTLPGVDDEIANAIVRRRGGTSAFSSIGELLDVSGMDKEKFAKLEGSVTVRSNTFRIRSEGLADSGLAKASIECVIDRGGQMPRTLYWLESTP